ncbi:MAG: hypothetical protein M1828_004063 [Chrysothrix sp. TS-e1954]|nr:MAG: hypothetical protein M1828_004063 [Chrysothrix sp. TS-e1954]
MPWHYLPDVDAFTIYHQVREETSSNSPSSSTLTSAIGHALAGSCGTAVSNIIVYPLDLVITRLQAQRKAERHQQPRGSDAKSDGEGKGKGKGRDIEGLAEPAEQEAEESYTSILDAFLKIHEKGGIPAFYAGITQDTAKSIIDSFLFFLFYNLLWHLNHRRRRRSPALSSSKPSSSSSAATNAGLADTSRRVLTEITMGVLAGASTKALTAPIQQIVTRKQTESSSSSSSSTASQPPRTSAGIARSIYETRGLPGFWAGYTASLILTLNPSLTFLSDSLLRRFVAARHQPQPSPSPSKAELSSTTTFLVAALGKAFASSLMYPISLAKTRAQVAGGGDGIGASIARILRTEGAGALYAGLGGEVLKGFFSHGLTMLVKERVVRGVVGVWGLLWRWVVWLRRGRWGG